LVAFPFAYLAIYLHGYHRPAHHPALGEGGFAVVRVTGQVLAMALGFGIAQSWVHVLAGMLLLGIATLAAVIRDARVPRLRPASLGLLAAAAGIVGVALVIGLGRAGINAKIGLASRYSYLTWPLLALAFTYWTSRGGTLGKWIPAGLCLAAAIAYPMNMLHGLQAGIGVRSVLALVEEEARAGVPPELIVRHFHDEKSKFQQGQEVRAVRAIPMLRGARVGPFAKEAR
jgi:hypothetical protein